MSSILTAIVDHLTKPLFGGHPMSELPPALSQREQEAEQSKQPVSPPPELFHGPGPTSAPAPVSAPATPAVGLVSSASPVSTGPRPLGTIQTDLYNTAEEIKNKLAIVAQCNATVANLNADITAAKKSLENFKTELSAAVAQVEKDAMDKIAGAKTFLEKLGL